MTSFYPLPLNKLYKVMVRAKDPTPEKISELLKVTRRTAVKYLNTVKWLRERLDSPPTLESLHEGLKNVLFKEFRVKEAVGLLSERGVPLTPQSLRQALLLLGIKVSLTEAKAIIEWMRQMDLVRERRVPLITEDLESRVLELVREKGSLTYGTLVKRYGEKVRDVVFTLWSEGSIRVPALESHREKLTGAKDLDKLPPMKGKVFATWHDRISGQTYSQLVIPARARIEARWDLNAV